MGPLNVYLMDSLSFSFFYYILLCFAAVHTKIHAFKLAGIIQYEHEGPESSSRNLKVCFKSVLMMSVRSCGSQCLNYCKWKHNDQISNKIIIKQNQLHLPADTTQEGRMKGFLAAVNERHVCGLCLSASQQLKALRCLHPTQLGREPGLPFSYK